MLLTALTKSPYFKDNPASLELCPPNQELQWMFFLCTQSAVSTEESASSTHSEARASASWLPRGVSACEPRCERPWGWPEAPAGEPRCFTTYPDPRRAYSWSSAFQLLTVQDTGSIPFSSVQLLSRVRLLATPWTIAHQASLSITNSQSTPKSMSIESVMPSNYLILYHPLLLLPPILPSIKVFSNESALHIRWPKYWIFSFNISPSDEHPGLISFRINWLDLLAVQGTLKSLLQHHGSNASILWCSAFFIVQLSHPYMTTGKAIALTRQNFVDQVMSLLLNMLSRLVITFLPRSKHLLISWLQSPSQWFWSPKQ